jgi:cysteine desulfurase
MVYFDNAATTPLDPEVIEVMSSVMKNNFGNPSSIHTYGREARVLIEDARTTVSSLLNVSPSEIFFTSCGTEAINMALLGCVENIGIKNIITSPIEHHAVLHTLEHLSNAGKCNIHFVKLDSRGNIDQDDLEVKLKSSDHSLVCLMHANNEIGNLLPIKDVGGLCLKYNSLFLCDTVQTMGKFRNSPGDMNIHFAACSAHKFHGPKGIGFLYLNGDMKIDPLLYGGGQERSMRSGTENIYGIIGLAKAFEIAHRNMDADILYIKGLKEYMVNSLKSFITDVRFNGDSEEKGLHIVLNVSFPRNDKSEMLLYSLDIEGIAASGGSACTSGSISESHVLKAIGADMNRPAIRVSFSKFNTKEEVDTCVDVIKKIMNV